MYLRAQGIDDNNGDIGGGIRALGLSNYDRGLGGGRLIDNASEGSETRRRRRGVNDGTKGSTTTTEALEKEDDTKDFNNNNGGVSRG